MREVKPPGLAAMIGGLVRFGLSGFGGVNAQARHMFVEREAWLDDTEFAEMMSLGQVLPGPNMMNLVAILGDRWHGLIGAVLGVAALIVPPVALALVLFMSIIPIERNSHVLSAERMIIGVAVGLMVATGLRMIDGFRARALLRAVLIAFVTILLVLDVRLALPLVVLSSLSLGFFLEVLLPDGVR
ncbi:MAG TPA: chromate transporter [Candidatus Baltobacteraceae bacterium]|nr:chromate transporter [Candidatus Baltobacteraceae bacterium]